VNRLLTVTGLALRELWISFRLLVAVALLIVAALPTALLPNAPQDLVGGEWTSLQLAAIGLAVALALVAGLAAGALAGERRRGTIGWLVSRSVPRAVVMLGWFGAFALVLLLGLAPAGALLWLTLGSATEALGGPAALAIPLLASWAAGLAAVALGLVLGSLLPGVPAALVTSVLVGLALVPGAAGLAPDLAASPAPAAGLAVIAGLLEASRPIADSLRSAGASLVGAAAALVLGAAALGRADL
jgi:ABC-type transport system involved in multi-copper enzyme maturation permease subunit